MIDDEKLAIILLGPPGAGKGTQAKLLARKLAGAHLGSGDVIRAKIKSQAADPQMQRFKEIYDKGELLPSEVVMKWAKEEIKKTKKNILVFEGWTRTVVEARELSSFLTKRGFEILILNLNISPEETVKRNTLRGRDIVDRPDKIKERLKVYEKETKPVLDFFGNKVIQINGQQSIEKVHQDILKAGRWSALGSNNESPCQSCQVKCPYRRT